MISICLVLLALVMMPVFEQVKYLQTSKGEDISSLRFDRWRDSSLSIKLGKGTSILNISYQDTDKSLITPVMEHISRTYKAYSGRDRSASLQKSLSYTKRT